VALVLNKNLSQRQVHGLKIEDCLVRLLQQIDAKISMKEFTGLASSRQLHGTWKLLIDCARNIRVNP
jgi:hypothetical protein